MVIVKFDSSPTVISLRAYPMEEITKTDFGEVTGILTQLAALGGQMLKFWSFLKKIYLVICRRVRVQKIYCSYKRQIRFVVTQGVLVQ